MSISEHKHMPEPVRRMEVFTGADRGELSKKAPLSLRQNHRNLLAG
jgi:hypothetical protein